MSLVLALSAAAFTPQSLVAPQPKLHHVARMQPACMAEGASTRRSLLGAAAAAATFAAIPGSAFADANEDAMAAIAAKNAANLAKEKEERRARLNAQNTEKDEEDVRGKTVLAAVAASVLLSVPFYYKNLIRLAIKVTGAGPDRNYDGEGEL